MADDPSTEEENRFSKIEPESADRAAQPVDAEEPPRLDFPVIGIGASAGGLEAMTELLSAIPADSGMAYVFIQHLPPSADSMLAEILGRKTAIPALPVEDQMPIERNHLYVIRPGHTLTIKDGRFHLGLRTAKAMHNRPVDDFFRSLAEEQRERAVAVILSGMGSNGAAGAQAIKAVGGLCIAQEPESAQYPSMPRHLIEAGYADYILRPRDIPEVLTHYADHPYAKGERTDHRTPDRREQETIREILAVLRTRTRQDFAGYKKPTVLRRIQRRMGLTRITNLGDYARLLRQSPTEVNALADDLLIHVTGFFRDPAAWETLREKIIVPLVAGRENQDAIRCWVTACSSGEEAYSLAMLLVEESERSGKNLDIKIFATDMAERTLQNARSGIYPGGIESEIQPQRLQRFFQQEDAVYRVRQDLRECVVFAPQNVLQDPPFSRLDIVSCRNLLIYLEPAVQQRILTLLHFGLREGGTLFLGTSETVGTEGLFEPIDKKARLYRRIGKTRHGAIDFPLPHAPIHLLRHQAPSLEQRLAAPRLSVAQLTERALLENHTPAAVTIDRDFRIVYFHGPTDLFLASPQGEPTRDLLALAREGVRGAARSAIHRAAAENATAASLEGWIETEPGRRAHITVTASPLEPKSAPEYLVVSFQRRSEPAIDTKIVDDPNLPPEELRRLREELQSTIEELQTSNEELKASHEEVVSINEELQSSNEELETSREEMQSLNEELSTVNTQLLAKMDELQATGNDLASLLTSTDIAVLFLDTTLRIRRFTPPVRDLLELISTDVGRPLADLARKFFDPDLEGDARKVLERLIPAEHAVGGQNGRFYTRRILPYRTADNRIEGVVITFIDVTELKQAQDALLASKDAAEIANRTKDEFLATLSHELRTPLGAILLWTKLLQSQATATPEEIRAGLSAIQTSAEAQQELIEDLLDMSRITSGKLRLNFREVDLIPVLQDALNAIALAAEDKKITIRSTLDPQVGPVRVDPDRIRQIVWNLLTNAVKFTPVNGSVELSLSRENDQVEIRVADTGRGIGPEFLPHVFERFRQEDPSHSRAQGGLGLGLAIVKQLAELHGGTVDVESPGDGKGAAFRIRIPYCLIAPRSGGDAEAPRPLPHAPLDGVTLLLVEDDRDTRRAVSLLLSQSGVHVLEAENAAAAMKIVQQTPGIDVIVSDIGLPGEDGYALIQRIRLAERTAGKKNVPAVALTAFAREPDRRLALDAGFQRHIPKPIDVQQFLDILQELVTPARPPPTDSSPGQP